MEEEEEERRRGRSDLATLSHCAVPKVIHMLSRSNYENRTIVNYQIHDESCLLYCMPIPAKCLPSESDLHDKKSINICDTLWFYGSVRYHGGMSLKKREQKDDFFVTYMEIFQQEIAEKR